MKMQWVLISACLLFSTTSMATPHQHVSPYAGEERREIKTLSAQDIDDLKNGRGWGLAKAAELNGVPGPIHLLEMQKEIHLTPNQLSHLTTLYQRMKQQAIELGNQLIDEEAKLNHLFAKGHATQELLKEQLEHISKIHRELRYVHLKTHLETPKILTKHQIAQYNELRGYTTSVGGQRSSKHDTNAQHSHSH